MDSPPDNGFDNWLDRLGATGSLLCAIHCAALPLLLATLPSLGVAVWLGDGFERVFVVFATGVGVFSLAWGWWRHRQRRALLALLPGLLLLWAGLLFQPLHESVWPHALVMGFGGALVGVAHLLNLQMNHLHRHDESCGH